MPATNSGLFTATRKRVVIDEDGSVRITFWYMNAAGALVVSREITLGPAQAIPVRDDRGNVVNATTPASLINARDAYLNAIDTVVANAAGNDKLDL